MKVSMTFQVRLMRLCESFTLSSAIANFCIIDDPTECGVERLEGRATRNLAPRHMFTILLLRCVVLMGTLEAQLIVIGWRTITLAFKARAYVSTACLILNLHRVLLALCRK